MKSAAFPLGGSAIKGLAEESAQVLGRAEAELVSDLGNGCIGAGQGIAGSFQSNDAMERSGREADFLFELCGEVRAGEVGDGGELAEMDVAMKVAIHEVHSLLRGKRARRVQGGAGSLMKTGFDHGQEKLGELLGDMSGIATTESLEVESAQDGLELGGNAEIQAILERKETVKGDAGRAKLREVDACVEGLKVGMGTGGSGMDAFCGNDADLSGGLADLGDADAPGDRAHADIGDLDAFVGMADATMMAAAISLTAVSDRREAGKGRVKGESGNDLQITIGFHRRGHGERTIIKKPGANARESAGQDRGPDGGQRDEPGRWG